MVEPSRWPSPASACTSWLPSLLSLFGAWPRLAEVQLRWFVLLVLLQAASFASLWWLTRLALEPHAE